MTKSTSPIPFIKTNNKKTWLYSDNYLGEKDNKKRRSDQGENHWRSAESIEQYIGPFVIDTMHGEGEYKWRYYKEQCDSNTYEGFFFANYMHGYGSMSYADGQVFHGLFFYNTRWGPGVETNLNNTESVGLWCGKQLIRLSWSHPTIHVIPDFNAVPGGKSLIEEFRIILTKAKGDVEEINSAIDILKHSGADPKIATVVWQELYPQHCTDLNSPLCPVKLFDQSYYQNVFNRLKEIENYAEFLRTFIINDDDIGPSYYAWNNSRMIIAMMKHSFEMEEQRSILKLPLTQILSGHRQHFKSAGKHENNCRALLMASYLGNTNTVAKIINEEQIHPNVTDAEGNNAIFYATSGNKFETIHFLAEAGAKINIYNDSCCTPLAVALMRYVAAVRDISPDVIAQAFIPVVYTSKLVPVQQVNIVTEWILQRQREEIKFQGHITRTQSKMETVKRKTMSASRETITGRKETRQRSKDKDKTVESFFTAENFLIHSITHEFGLIAADEMGLPFPGQNVSTLYNINDMFIEINENLEEKDTAAVAKKPDKSAPKTTARPSKEALFQEDGSLDTAGKIKMEILSRIKLTIQQLLLDGANPKSVRCPIPALAMATIAESDELIHLLLEYEADLHETYPQLLNYSALEIAISKPLKSSTVAVVKALLERGAKANMRLRFKPDNSDEYDYMNGPTLLHAVLAKTPILDIESQVQEQLLEMLLEFGCDATAQFNGKSAIDVTIAKKMNLINIFVKCRKIDLNSVINNNNQNILVKVLEFQFYKMIEESTRIPMLTNFLIYGADPLKKCQDGDDSYENFFVYAKHQLFVGQIVKSEIKVSKKGAKGDDKGKTAVANTKTLAQIVEDYKQAIKLMSDCTRLNFIRWIQANLFKELVQVVFRVKHRSWHIILREHKRQKETGLWLNVERAIEIWNILKTTKKKYYMDKIVLKLLLYIVHYYNYRDYMSPKLTIVEKERIESEVNKIMLEYVSMNADSAIGIPELVEVTEKKYNVCFECMLPFDEEYRACSACNIVAFCSRRCERANARRPNCHPCTYYTEERLEESHSKEM